MTPMIKIHVDHLSGSALTWALNSIDPPFPPTAGQIELPLFADPADEARGNQLIAKYNVWVEPGHSYPWLSCVNRCACNRRIGETRVIAIFRAVVAFKLGETVQVPRELVS